jgi:hypothetical protein
LKLKGKFPQLILQTFALQGLAVGRRRSVAYGGARDGARLFVKKEENRKKIALPTARLRRIGTSRKLQIYIPTYCFQVDT